MCADGGCPWLIVAIYVLGERVWRLGFELLEPASVEIEIYATFEAVGGIGADVQRPLAIVVVFGLGTSTLLTLFVIPAVYLWIEERAERKPA